MQIEWSEEEVLKLESTGKRRWSLLRAWERESVVENGGIEGAKVRIRSGAGRTGAERGEPCRVFELWASRFMPEL